MADSDTKPGRVDEKTGFRVATSDEIDAAHKKLPRTGDGNYRATQRGYAIVPGGAGILVEEGQLVPADVPVSDEWMEKVKGKTSPAAKAIEDVSADRKDDPDLTQLSIGALQALATERGVTQVRGLSKADLIQAIQASDEQRRL